MSHNTIEYLELFRKKGYRVTKQRQAIMDAICQADGHASISEIYQKAKILDEGIDRSTVYRNLEVFVEIGLVNVADDVKGGRVYELVREEPHHHLICKQCGSEIEIDNRLVEELYLNLETHYNYRVEMDHLIVFGSCAACSSGGKR